MTLGERGADASVAPAVQNRQKQRENRRISENPAKSPIAMDMTHKLMPFDA